MKAALLTEDGRERELIFLLSRKEFDTLYEALEAAAKAHPRKTTFGRLLRSLEKAALW